MKRVRVVAKLVPALDGQNDKASGFFSPSPSGPRRLDSTSIGFPSPAAVRRSDSLLSLVSPSFKVFKAAAHCLRRTKNATRWPLGANRWPCESTAWSCIAGPVPFRQDLGTSSQATVAKRQALVARFQLFRGFSECRLRSDAEGR